MARHTLILTLSPALLLAACGGASEPASEPASDPAGDSAASSSSVTPATSATVPATTPSKLPAATGADFTALTGDATRGKSVYNQCRACHSIEAGRNGIGPSLFGIVGRSSGAVPGYAYSSANKAANINWAPETLFTYLSGPSRMVPGTKMGFILTDAQKRADVIAYLQTLK